MKEIDDGIRENEKLRSSGAGRKKLQDVYPDIEDSILKIVDKETYGDPEKPLSYTTMSLRDIRDVLKKDFGIDVSFRSISSILEKLGYSKQANQKMLQAGKQHPDRNAQFEFINDKADSFLEQGLPVISVDTKKKENIGNFKNNGQEYRPKGNPRKVLDHDFPTAELGKVAPYEMYVLNDNTGFVNLGTDHDTAEFAAESILRWWECVGNKTFPDAKSIYINCDNGGSFCFISKKWQGQPLINIETVVSLISDTKTSKGLTVKCVVDKNKYEL